MRQLKWMLVVAGSLLALAATVLAASAAAPGLARGGGVAAPPAAPLAACTSMSAEEVVWVTLDEDGQIDQQVDAYESGVTEIVPVFQYNCVPSKASIVSVFSLNGEPVFTDKESLKASSSGGLYGYPLGTTDGSALDDGEWSVEFYNNKTLLTEGSVVVGDAGDNPSGNSATVEGTVKDKRTKKPIKGAVVLILVPGVTAEDWVSGGKSQDDILTVGKSDSKGYYKLENTLERVTPFSIIIVAKGYKSVAADGFVIGVDDDDPYQIDVTLTK